MVIRGTGREVRAKGGDRRPPLQGQEGTRCPSPSPHPCRGLSRGQREVLGEVSPTHGALALPCWPTRPAPHPGSGSRKKKARGEVGLESCTLQTGCLGQPGRAGGRPPPAGAQRTRRLASDSAALPSRSSRPVGQAARTRQRPRSAVTLTGRQTPAPPVLAWGALLGGSGETPPSLPPGPQAGTHSFSGANKAHPPGGSQEPPHEPLPRSVMANL